MLEYRDRVIRDKQYKLFVGKDRQPEKLIDLHADPDEKIDLPGYSVLRLDRPEPAPGNDAHRGGIVAYIREDRTPADVNRYAGPGFEALAWTDSRSSDRLVAVYRVPGGKVAPGFQAALETELIGSWAGDPRCANKEGTGGEGIARGPLARGLAYSLYLATSTAVRHSPSVVPHSPGAAPRSSALPRPRPGRSRNCRSVSCSLRGYCSC